MLIGSATWGASLCAFGLVPNAWIGLAFLVLAGAADTASVVARGTIVQLNTPDRLRGRVAAAEQIVGQAGPDLGNLRGGLVAGATSGPVALVSGGLLCLAAVALVAAPDPRSAQRTRRHPTRRRHRASRRTDWLCAYNSCVTLSNTMTGRELSLGGVTSSSASVA